MGLFRQPKPPAAITPPNPDDVANRVNDERKRRLATGGRNATALGAMAAATSGSGRQSPNTLTGLNGGV